MWEKKETRLEQWEECLGWSGQWMVKVVMAGSIVCWIVDGVWPERSLLAAGLVIAGLLLLGGLVCLLVLMYREGKE